MCFRNCLSNWQKIVDVYGTVSDVCALITIVLQGSILGPLVYILHRNDIHIASKQSNFILYADDTNTVL